MIKMKITFFIFILIFVEQASSKSDFGLKMGFGMPTGIMDLSLNAGSYLRFPQYKFINPEVISHFSWSINGISEEVEGIYSMLSTSIYALARYQIMPSTSRILPYVSPGIGIHYLISLSEANSPVGEHGFSKYWRHAATIKAHAFFGTEFLISQTLFLFFEGRVTYPSDIILDSGFIGLGMKFR